MAKTTKQYVCQSCGATHSKWGGRCDQCGEWNTLVEETKQSEVPDSHKGHGGDKLTPTQLSEVDSATDSTRFGSGFSQADRVFGGGIVAGSVMLLAGEPGIGKSTLILQLAANIAQDQQVLYVGGEESLSQIKLRARRLGIDNSAMEMLAATKVNDITSTLEAEDYDFVVIDSIQTMSVAELSSSAGTVSQIINSAQALQRSAKKTNTSLLMIGHVTKEGSIAGPKQLEHLVDVVLYLEGDEFGSFKILRGKKNRFGTTNEVAIFEMKNSGLQPVDNPSQAFLSERQSEEDGSAVLATIEGTHALLVEVQALVTDSPFGYPKRTAVGFDQNRLNLLIAVLGKRAGLQLGSSDIYVNVVGGISIEEPASDLAVALAIASSFKNQPIAEGSVVFGEIGLSGEIRSCPQIDKRVAEAEDLGFKQAIGPKTKDDNDFIKPAETLREALELAL